MVTHFVCLDGTDALRIQPHPTNVSRLFDALGGVAIDAGNGSFEASVAGPPAQLGKYLPGVGSQGNPILRILGDAFGDGIAEPIVRGYTFLSRSYAPGDAIVISGFSRGAAAARALAGFVCGQGLLDRTRYDTHDKNAGYLRAIAAWYAYRKERPDMANLARVDFISTALDQTVPTLGAGDLIPPPAIRAVAVFDTVSSLGLPQLDANGDPVFDFNLCDTALSENVQNGLHALAADEMRDLFAPTFWTARDGVVQEVFPGSHSNVGGGLPELGLSDAALSWMLARLESVGMVFDRTKVSPPIAPNPLDIARDAAVTFPFNGTPSRPRAFPPSAAPSASLLARWGKPTEVLPGAAVTPYAAAGTYEDGAPLH